MSLRNLLVIVFQRILSTDNALASRVELLKFNPLSTPPPRPPVPPPPQNGETHSNNSPAFVNELNVFDYFVGLPCKGLNYIYWYVG